MFSTTQSVNQTETEPSPASQPAVKSNPRNLYTDSVGSIRPDSLYFLDQAILSAHQSSGEVTVPLFGYPYYRFFEPATYFPVGCW